MGLYELHTGLKLNFDYNLTHDRSAIPARTSNLNMQTKSIYDSSRWCWPFNIAIRSSVIGEHCTSANSGS